MDDDLVRLRIKRALTPDGAFPDPTLLARTLSRLPEGRRQAIRGPALLMPVALALAFAIIAALVTSHVLQAGRAAAPGGVSPAASVPPPASTRAGGVSDFRFVSASAGWLLENAPDGSARVLRTADGGAHWTVAGELGASRPYLSTLNAFDDRQAVVVGPAMSAGGPPAPGARIWSTLDAGAHWQVADVPAAMGFMSSGQFADPREGWLVTAPAIADDVAISVYHTSDGGQHWELVASGAADPALAGLTSKARATFSGRLDGWLSSFRRQPAGPVLLATHDGGRTWRPLDLTPPPGVDMRSRQLSADLPAMFGKQGLILAATLPTGSNAIDDGRYVYATQDGGLHWSYVRRVPGLGVSFLDMTRWMRSEFGAAGMPDELAISDDAGRTWSTSRAPLTAAGWFWNRPSFIGPAGWIIVQQEVGKGGLGSHYAVLVTADTGVHWSEAQLPAG